MTVVYTALFGGSDRLKPAPRGADRAVLVTDQPQPRAKQMGWDVRLWPIAPEPRRAAWDVRCRPDWLALEADVTVWGDASFTWTNLPALLRDAGDAECAGFAHPHRTSCYEEGETLVSLGQASPWAIKDQLAVYRAAGYTPTGLTTAGLLVRRATPLVDAFNTAWADEIRRHRGDNTQVSLDYAAWKVGLPIRHLKGTYIDNPYVVYDGADHRARRQAYAW